MAREKRRALSLNSGKLANPKTDRPDRSRGKERVQPSGRAKIYFRFAFLARVNLPVSPASALKLPAKRADPGGSTRQTVPIIFPHFSRDEPSLN
jgi:hypothetical protein